MVSLPLLLFAPGCSGDDSGLPKEAITAQREELTSPLVSERVIPLRIVQMLATAGQADLITLDDMRKRVQETNWAFKSAGVQVYIAKWEKLVMPTFNTIDPDATTWYWPQVREQLKLALPGLTDTSFSTADRLSETLWLESAAGKAADRSELLIFIPQTLSNGYYWGTMPTLGGPSAMLGPGITWKFTHELGHVFGLAHTHDPWPNGYNPITKTANPGSDSWDLVFVPADTTFTNRTTAQSSENQLQRKNVTPQNCSVDATCTVTCNINGTDYVTGSTMLKGLAFTFAGDAPGTPRRGFNAMSYIDGDSNCAINGDNGVALSNSQTVQVRRSLRYDVFVDNPGALLPRSLNITAGRPFLGDWRGRSSIEASLAEVLDLDGDGKREIGVWQPPVNPQALGTFRFLLSTTGYNPAQPLVRSFGYMGDVPVMADYDGDGKTDIGVYQTGGATGSDPYSSQAYWRYCKSSSTPTSFDCANPGSEPWGLRTDVPLPGTNFDGNAATGEVAIYRPSTGEWWWKLVGIPGSNRILGNGSSFASRRVQVPGLYDNDEKTDIVYYDPLGGTFGMLLSSSAWAQASRIDRAFPPNVIPFGQWGLYDAGGVMVMRRAQTLRYLCNPVCFYRPRRVLLLWEEYSGVWYTMWNPVTSSTVSTCAWGAAQDLPLSGLIDRDSDGKSDFVFWRSSDADSGGTFYFKNSAGTACTGTTLAVAPGSYPFSPSPSTIVLPVWDMNGDSKDELMMVNPDTLWWWRLNSQGYTTGAAVQLGASGAVPL